MSESAMWDSLRPLIKILDPVRVENPIVPGTPDVNYCDGWIELKFMPAWPPKGGPLRVDHFTKKQRCWIIRRRAAGGKAFVLLKVGEREWLLFDGKVAAVLLGHVPQGTLYRASLARWTRLPTTKEITKCLMG